MERSQCVGYSMLAWLHGNSSQFRGRGVGVLGWRRTEVHLLYKENVKWEFYGISPIIGVVRTWNHD